MELIRASLQQTAFSGLKCIGMGQCTSRSPNAKPLKGTMRSTMRSADPLILNAGLCC